MLSGVFLGARGREGNSRAHRISFLLFTLSTVLLVWPLAFASAAADKAAPSQVADNKVVTHLATPTVTLVSSANPTTVGGTVLFTATVTGVANRPIPTGTVTFSSPGFTIAVFPDIQNMTGPLATCCVGSPAQFQAMTNWVVNNRSAYNIQAVAGLGDNVNCNAGPAWADAAKGWNTLLHADIPSVSSAGNHDYDMKDPSECDNYVLWGSMPYYRLSTNFLANLGPSVLGSYSWYGGSFESADSSTSANQWIKFTVGGQKYAILALEFCPRPEALLWARNVIKANADTEFIVDTHQFLDQTGVPIIGGCYTNPHLGVDGQHIWMSGLQSLPNVFLVLSGHLNPASGVSGSRNALTGSQQNSVAAVFTNYQYENQQSGTLQLAAVHPAAGYLALRAYSTSMKSFRTDASNAFLVPLFGASIEESSEIGSVPLDAPAPLNGGVATYSFTAPAAGTNVVTASYSGDLNYVSASSELLSQVAIQLTPSIHLASSPNPARVGEYVTFTATVEGVKNAALPTGSVEFYSASSALGSASLSDGVAAFSTGNLTAGSHSITAKYQGGAIYTEAVSNAVLQTIEAQ